MAQNSGVRTTNQAITETRLVRNVAADMANLEPNVGAILTFMMKLKKTEEVKSPRVEWTETDYVARWTTTAGTATNVATTLAVTDGTLFQAGDLFIVPNAASSSTVPEVIRVASISTNTLTIVRGAGAVSIANAASIRIIGSAFEENSGAPTAKSTAPSVKISYSEIFKTSFEYSRTAMASETYAAPKGEYERAKTEKLTEHKQQINSSFLFGTASESLTGGPNSNPIRTTMGVNSVVTTNVTDAGGILTRKTFESFSQSAFRYASGPRMLLAAPTVISAISQWASAHQFLSPSENVFGVSVQKFTTGHGVWMLVRDWMLENGVSGKNGFGGWSFSLDMDSLTMFHLRGAAGLPSGEPHLQENIQAVDQDGKKSQYLADCGLKLVQEKRFAKLYDVTDYEG